MKETEVKILEVNRQKIERTLRSLDAKKVFDGEVETLFFDFQDGSIIKQKNVLRLRKEKDKIELTYKKVHITKTVKTAEEYSVEVSSIETVEKILKNLGLKVIERTRKHRISYILDNARFDFDCYSGNYDYIPEFLEIEAKNTDSLYKYAELLGFKANDCLPWSTTDLIKHYASKRTIS